MHPAAFAYVARTVVRYPPAPGSRVVEIGSRIVNGSIRSLFELIPHLRYLGTDVTPGPGVDHVGDGATLVLPVQAHLVVCCEVLEHTASAQAILANSARLLAPGGRLILTAAGCSADWAREPHSAVDGGPLQDGEFYRNVAPADLHAWLNSAGFLDIDVEVSATAKDVYATAITPSQHDTEDGGERVP